MSTRKHSGASVLLLLGPVDRPLSGDGLESGLDALHRTAGVAGHALQEEQPCLLLQDGVGRPAGVARHVLLDVPAIQERTNEKNCIGPSLYHVMLTYEARSQCASAGIFP